MAKRKSKLELNWIGKENKPKLEPRILIEHPTQSYHAAHRISDNDIFDNRLIFGDNLLALKSLESQYKGQIKCVYIDPPFNTGQAFDHYEDGIEHSLWLSLMSERLNLLREMLTIDGTLWISIDDNEGHYLKVLCDEVFGRNCFIASVIWRSTDNSNNDAKQFSIDHNMILVYSKAPGWRSNRIPPTEKQISHFKNPDNDPRGAYFDGNPVSSPNYRENLIYDVKTPSGKTISSPRYGWRWSKEKMQEMIESGEIRFTPDETGIRRRTYLKDRKGLPPSSLWADLEQTGHNRQAKYEQKKLFPERNKDEWFPTPKPERLIWHILRIATNPGDIVLDSFAGSGTTCAVAHKMRRSWIVVELGDHCNSHILPRMKKIIDGVDKGGISDMVEWKGGGGFRYYTLGPSLISNDIWGNPIINPDFNPEMLAEAMCKLEGFEYSPSEELYWMHGKSTEQDFIFVTTQFMTNEMLTSVSDEVGTERSLLICCAAFRSDQGQFLNLTIKKIPKAVLKKCEWGHDDYSLEIQNLPKAVEESQITPAQASLFDMGGDK
ncbi:site-specific DNA-methyltransferase [candidate division KSB1 bacterium]